MTATPTRHRVGRRSRASLLVAWALATLGGVLVAATTRIGPVVLAITTNHGVHAGDLVGFGVCYGTVLLGTLLRPSRPDRTPEPLPRPDLHRANGAFDQPRRPNGTLARPGPPAPRPGPRRANGAFDQPHRTNGAFDQRGRAVHDEPTRVLRLDEVVTRPLRLANAPTHDPRPRRRA